MTERAGTDCSPWCHVDHGRGRALHKTCTGEVLWHNDSAAVEFAQYRGNDFIVLLAYGKNEGPVGANLTLDEARDLCDALGAALASERAA